VVMYAIGWLIVLFLCFINFVYLLCRAFRCCKRISKFRVCRCCTGISEKPYYRSDSPSNLHPTPPSFFFELTLNGKYYLWRTYITEFAEIIYQLINYRIYACSMKGIHLVVYTGGIFFEAIYRLFGFYPVCDREHRECSRRRWLCCMCGGGRSDFRKHITADDKNRDMICDLLVDCSSLIYPTLVMYLNGVVFKEEELVLITALPLACLVLKMRIAFRAMIIQLLYDIELDYRIKAEDTTGNLSVRQRTRRRSTHMDNAQSHVLKLQNEKCPLKCRFLLYVENALIALLFFSLVFFPVVNYFMLEESVQFKKYCKVSAPMCDNWFGWEENCFHVALWQQSPERTDETLMLFKESTAAQLVEWSGIQNGSTLENVFPRLRSLELFETNATYLPNLETWPDISKVRITEAPKLVEIRGCCTKKTDIRVIYIFSAPKLKFKELDIPYAHAFRVGGVGKLPREIIAPNLKTLSLANMKLKRLPKAFRGIQVRELFLPGNNLMDLDGSEATFIVDIRYNNITDYKGALPQYAYAHGNIVCPTGFNCEPFCAPSCSNMWYEHPETDFCVTECIASCGLSTECKKDFEVDL